MKASHITFALVGLCLPSLTLAKGGDDNKSSTTKSTSLAASTSSVSKSASSTLVSSSTPAVSSVIPSQATSSTPAQAQPSGFKIQIHGGNYNNYYIYNSDPTGKAGVADLTTNKNAADIFYLDAQSGLFNKKGQAISIGNQDAASSAQPVFFNTAETLAQFTYDTVKCTTDGNKLSCSSGPRSVGWGCVGGITTEPNPTFWLVTPESSLQQGCSASTLRIEKV